MRLALLAGLLLLGAPCGAEGDPGLRPMYGPRRGLIHPLISIDLGGDSPKLDGLRRKVEAEIAAQEKDGIVTQIAVNFADMERGVRFGIGEQTSYRPASLFKLPVLIAFLKRHEADPALLSRRVALLAAPVDEFQLSYPPRTSLTVGLDYSIDELLRAMIARSDNNAAFTLNAYLDKQDFANVFRDLGLPPPDMGDPNTTVTPRRMCMFLEILYQAGYLSWDLSQKSMEYLAASEFEDGLRAKLPPGIVVAHKFGESGRPGEAVRQLHDCGFVFAPRGPYLLCVMTKGTNQKRQAAAIAAVSDLVYRALADAPEAAADAPPVKR